MSSELAVIPNRSETLRKIGINDDGVSTISKLIKKHIKEVMELKGPEARDEYYRLLRDVVAPVTAAAIQRATAQGWLNELRLGKVKKGKTEIEDFTVKYFKPIQGKPTYVSAARLAQLEKEGLTQKMKELLIKEGMIRVDQPRTFDTTATKSEPEAAPSEEAKSE